jgi:glycosyltransferase 2 family protein
LNPRLQKALKLLLPIALGVFLVWYSYHITTPEDRVQIVRYIQGADKFWVGISVLIGILSHISRAIRWNFLLQPLGYKPGITNNVLIILIAYFANLGIPRSGEVLRATALATYEGVPFEKGFGTIVTERVVDLIMLILIILVTLILQTDILLNFLDGKGISLAAMVMLLAAGVFGLFLFLAFLRRSTNRFAIKIKNLIKGLLDGVMSIFRMKRKWRFIWHTLFIWGGYIAMFWVIKYTVPETLSLSLDQILVGFVAGAFAMSTTNGGIGLYPIAVSGSLAIYGISDVSGDAFGWIMWISQTLMVVVFGAISFLVLPLLNRNR